MTATLQPADQHNLRLRELVHPPRWVNPQPRGRYNLVVIGAGTAGLVTAAGAAGLGAKVALIERDLTGGDCLNTGCVPSKALIRCARAAADARDARRFGVHVEGDVRVDFGEVMTRMRRLRAEIAENDSVQRFTGLGVDVFLGSGAFTGPETIAVAGQTLRFSRAVIATGARAAMPPIPGLAEAGALTNETLFSLTELPARLAIIGGGPIGCEMAQAFARFGSRVVLLEAGPQILGREDRDAVGRIEAALAADGVEIVCDAKVIAVQRRGTERVLRLETGDSAGSAAVRGATRELSVDAILVGVGRAPNVEGLGLEQAGVRYDERNGVAVDDHLRTSNPRIYAAGDICSRFKFTHAADAAARIVIRNALFFGRARASALTMPWCTYTDPEIAHVGLYESEAAAAGIAVQTFTVELKDVDRALLDGEEAGFLKVHVRAGSDAIVGATLVARHAGEMLSEVTLAMGTKAGLGALSRTIHPYPTQASAFARAGDAYSRTRLTPFAKRLTARVMSWRR